MIAFACWATAIRPVSFLDAEPDQSRKYARRGQRYKVEPYVVCADLYSTPPHVGRGGGPGTPARQDGCTGPALEWISGSVCRGDRCISIHASPDMAGLRVDFGYRSARYDDLVSRTRRGVCRGVQTIRARRY